MSVIQLHTASKIINSTSQRPRPAVRDFIRLVSSGAQAVPSHALQRVSRSANPPSRSYTHSGIVLARRGGITERIRASSTACTRLRAQVAASSPLLSPSRAATPSAPACDARRHFFWSSKEPEEESRKLLDPNVVNSWMEADAGLVDPDLNLYRRTEL
eukprot:3158702-Pleurochrysis_carterae.AAC.2